MADVIEDVEHLLERAIQCLTYVLNNLLNRVNRNKHRPLNRRTLVRWISAFMPAPRDPRVRLQPSLGDAPSCAALQRWASSGSLGSAFSMASLNQLVEEDLGDNLVRFRVGNAEEDDEVSSVVFGSDDAHFTPIPDLSSRFTSTPNFDESECASAISTDQQATGGKLAEMEAELATLRKQIAMLVMAQESSMMTEKDGPESDEESQTMSTTPAAALPLPLSPALCSTLNDSGCESSEGAPTVRQKLDSTVSPGSSSASSNPEPVVPPPPPPLPPPPPPLLCTPSGESVAEMIRKRKATTNSTRQSRGAVPDMADILKGLGSVKLRAVDRSPGGTPMGRRKLDRTPTDPASIIARALKKKFASQRGLSPESDQENDANSFMSDGAASPFGQHMLKKTARRLSLFNDSDDWTPASSPLRTLNV